MSASRPSLAAWMLALGGAGFAAGFLGPILLNPQANQGPLLGIFISGPAGVLTGLVVGALPRVLSVPAAVQRSALRLAGALTLLTTLWFCLPRPLLLGYVIDGEITGCVAAEEAGEGALSRWRQAVARTTWAQPAADWQQTALRNLAEAGGVVLTVAVQRRVPIFRHRRPWERGRVSAGGWSVTDVRERYYARERGRACAHYLAAGRHLYWPFSESAGSAQRAAPAWPPTDPAGFLPYSSWVHCRRNIGVCCPEVPCPRRPGWRSLSPTFYAAEFAAHPAPGHQIMKARAPGYVPSLSDAVVKARTGRGWAGWFRMLDRAGANRLAHRQIAEILSSRHKVPGWWCQMVTVEYERARGLRARHQTASGYSVAVSKTLATRLGNLYSATARPGERRKWFPRGAFEASSQTRDKYFRGRWKQNSRLEIGFYARGAGKSQIAVQVSRLPRKGDVEPVRHAWKGALSKLQTLLED